MTYSAPPKGDKLFGFEVSPGDSAGVANVPVTVDLGRVRTGSNIEVGNIDAIDRHTGRVPGIDIRAQVAGLPTEGARAVISEWGGDGRSHRTAS